MMAPNTSKVVEVVEVVMRFRLLFIFLTDLCAKGKKWGLTSTTSTLSGFLSTRPDGCFGRFWRAFGRLTPPPGWVLPSVFPRPRRLTQADEKRVSNAVSCSCMEVCHVVV